MGKLFILSASLVKYEPGKTITSIMQGYRLSESEDAAKGSFLTAVMAERPGFPICEILCLEIPEATIRAALSEGEP